MEKSKEQIRLETNARVDELNALSLAENLADLRVTYDARIAALENEVRKLNQLVSAQSQTIGNALQTVMGRGSTAE